MKSADDCGCMEEKEKVEKENESEKVEEKVEIPVEYKRVISFPISARLSKRSLELLSLAPMNQIQSSEKLDK